MRKRRSNSSRFRLARIRYTKSETSRRMAAVKQRETAPEMTVRAALHAIGFRFRTHVGTLPGRPDVVFPKFKTILMVHGCFWHHHRNCARATIPNANRDFWLKKFVGNSRRDKLNASHLRRLGWRVLTVWECRLTPSRFRKTVETLSRKIRNAQPDYSVKE